MEKKKILYNFFEGITPSELSKVRGKMQQASTRDKERFLKKVSEIEEVLHKLNAEIIIKKSD